MFCHSEVSINHYIQKAYQYQNEGDPTLEGLKLALGVSEEKFNELMGNEAFAGAVNAVLG